MQQQILYCEDEPIWRKTFRKRFKLDAPEYSLINAVTVREGLTKVTGIDLDNLEAITLNNVLTAIKKGNPNYDLLKIVLTDGELEYSNYPENKESLYGWDLAHILRESGYKGKIVYIGGKRVPGDKKSLFSSIFSKWDDEIYEKSLKEIKE